MKQPTMFRRPIVRASFSLPVAEALVATQVGRAANDGPPTGEEWARFWDKVNETESCWLWHGATVTSKSGSKYGVLKWRGKRITAHRFVFLFCVGPLEDGEVPDHQCEHTLCVNPKHLKAATGRENTLRGNSASARNARRTACSKGHPFEGDNLVYRMRRGRKVRACRKCQHEYNVARRVG